MTTKLATNAPRAIRNTKDLLAAGLIEPGQRSAVDEVTEEFSVAITGNMLAAIGEPSHDDPVYRQFIPSAEELTTHPEELLDPIGDDPFTPVKGITHRYPDRLLLKPVLVCPVYCRFCFRREKVGPGSEALSEAELNAALDYIRSHPEVWEVILTGGDPMILSARRIAALVAQLDAIPHVEVIRFHTRVPVVDPGRITAEMVEALRVATPVYVCIHTNHAREFTPEARAACARLVDHGIPLLSQTVLLRGINDDPQSMEELLRTLVKNRIKPYYLHHGDLARGTSHLRTSIATGQRLMRALRGRVSGICQPTYVLDIPGGYGKVPIGHNFVERLEGGSEASRFRVEDIHGKRHDYPPSPLPDGVGRPE